MTRETIDYGIDLGTTNSAIAVISGADATVIKNNDGFDTTPSTIWIDKRGRRNVGRAARERSKFEPTAAALAYGFQTASDSAFWLAYDLGGGTFDAAVVQVRDGEFNVVQHEGDNFLGGKLVDWRIVEELLIPAVVASHTMPGLARGNSCWFEPSSQAAAGHHQHRRSRLTFARLG